MNPKTQLIDHGEMRKIALIFRPKMIVAGSSTYSHLMDYEKIAEIASEVSAYVFIDMAHIAGLVAAIMIPRPAQHSDFVTFTTFKPCQAVEVV